MHQCLVINFQPVVNLTTDKFWQFCVANPDLRLEHSAAGELIIRPFVGGITGNRIAHLNYQLCNWTDIDGTGIAFGSSTGFTLSNGATLSPTAAWLRKERWDAITQEHKEYFLPFCPDFIIELIYQSDNPQSMQAKMQEYIDNGAKLAWLINRKSQQVTVYRPQQRVENLDCPDTISGGEILPGFTLQLKAIW